MQINRRETILVLSKLLGYVGIDDTCHGLRVGYIVWRLSEHLKLPDDQRVDTIALYSNLIFLADRLDILLAHNPTSTEVERGEVSGELV